MTDRSRASLEAELAQIMRARYERTRWPTGDQWFFKRSGRRISEIRRELETMDEKEGSGEHEHEQQG